MNAKALPFRDDLRTMSRGRAQSGRLRAACVLLFVWTLFLAGCGYTVIKHEGGNPQAGDTQDDNAPNASTKAGQSREPGSASERDTADSTAWLENWESDLEGQLPPGHPPVYAEDWIGRSFLDHIVGEDYDLRFENLRRDPLAKAPSLHAIVTVRITLGGPAVADIWQIRMDEFGWVTASHWMQGSAGPTLDETTATEKAEFRLERQSESALRELIIELLPRTENPRLTDLPQLFRSLPPERWPYADAGLIEFEYCIESLGLVSQQDWPGGRVRARLDLIQLLIGTWDSEPPLELRGQLAWVVRRHPEVVNIALLAEAIALAWEVEGYGAGPVDLPLWVGR